MGLDHCSGVYFLRGGQLKGAWIDTGKCPLRPEMEQYKDQKGLEILC